MTAKKTIKAWAIFDPHGIFCYWLVQMTQKATRDQMGVTWPSLKKAGYRVRRITITVED
jgi:predicted homoserine dehydrogenase-like protein